MKYFRNAILATAFLPSLAMAHGTPVPDASENTEPTVSVEKVQENIYLLRNDQGGNVTISIGEDGTFIIDDQLVERKDDVEKAIREIKDENVKFIVNTHYHFDHTGGNEHFGDQGAIIVAHDNVRKRLSSDQFVTYFSKHVDAMPKSGLPVVTFSEDVTLHYNGDSVKIIHLPNAHTDGDAAAHFTNENIVVIGDLVFNGMYPFIDTEHGGSIKGVIDGLDKLLALGNASTKYIPGHGTIMNKTEVQHYRDTLAAIKDNIESAIKDGKSLEETVAMKPTAKFDEEFGVGLVGPDAFTDILYEDLAGTVKRVD